MGVHSLHEYIVELQLCASGNISKRNKEIDRDGDGDREKEKGRRKREERKKRKGGIKILCNYETNFLALGVKNKK